MTWQLKEKLRAVLAQEEGAYIYAPGARSGFALLYPNTYHVGMSNLGLHIIYQQINERNDTACERIFLPDKKTLAEYERTSTPLLTLETGRPLYEFPLIGVAMTFEMDYFNLLQMLAMGRVPLLASERDENDSFVILGGACATFNPEPLADFVDVCVIGEGEETIHALLDAYYQARRDGLKRREILKAWSAIEGLYVPSLYRHEYNDDGTIAAVQPLDGAPAQVRRCWVKDLDKYPAHTVVTGGETEFGRLHLVEVARGCGRHCRFCMAGYCYREPRVRTPEKLYAQIDEAKRRGCKAGLMGAAISDYPFIDELCAYITEHETGMSVASLRADSLTTALVEALAYSGQRTITLAPEAGSERLRRVINKGITDKHLFDSIDMAINAGIRNVRLYIMIGLPFETEEDCAAIVTMSSAVKRHMTDRGSNGKLTLSVNPFIPKPFTPFQWYPMAGKKDVTDVLAKLSAAFKGQKQIEVLVENPREAYIQAILARGDRRLSAVLLAAYRDGIKGWKRAIAEQEVDEEFYLYRQRDFVEILPWHTLNMGFDTEYLKKEFQKSAQAQTTVPCFDGCIRCGICRKK